MTEEEYRTRFINRLIIHWNMPEEVANEWASHQNFKWLSQYGINRWSPEQYADEDKMYGD